MPPVLTTTSFTIRFSRFLLPSTVLRQSICIQSKFGPVNSSADCQGPSELFLEPTYDPTRREVTYRQAPSGPRLQKGANYQLTVLPPPPDTVLAGGGFRAFDGARLERPVVFQFSTVAEDPTDAVLEGPVAGDLFCRAETCENDCAASKQVGACQMACPTSCAAACMCDPAAPECTNNCPADDADCRKACNACLNCKPACLTTCTSEKCATGVLTSLSACVFGGCHQSNELLGAAMGLDLSTPDAIAMTAINRVAKQTQQGEAADEPDRSPIRFGRAMPIIDPQNPGNSYLLYKLAVGMSATGDSAPTPEEIARLRGSVVVGMPMPPKPGVPIRPIDMSAIADWIAQGAPTPACQ
ncbi:MAG TPA: hypothetical protein VE093_13030 [Polyangiaceae bacterium]|jgi:hypothetical protein|nr:hypothetical protein [Polyangiaceae bacterium]